MLKTREQKKNVIIFLHFSKFLELSEKGFPRIKRDPIITISSGFEIVISKKFSSFK